MSYDTDEIEVPADHVRREPRIKVEYVNGNGQANWIMRTALGALASCFLLVFAWVLINVISLNNAQAADRIARDRDHNLLCAIAAKNDIITGDCLGR